MGPHVETDELDPEAIAEATRDRATVPGEVSDDEDGENREAGDCEAPTPDDDAGGEDAEGGDEEVQPSIAGRKLKRGMRLTRREIVAAGVVARTAGAAVLRALTADAAGDELGRESRAAPVIVPAQARKKATLEPGVAELVVLGSGCGAVCFYPFNEKEKLTVCLSMLARGRLCPRRGDRPEAGTTSHPTTCR
jgi:hypothetical protein